MPTSCQLGSTARCRGLEHAQRQYWGVLPSARTPATGMMTTLTRASGACFVSGASSGWRWRGRCVKLADGTSISMPDTPANQAGYPQPSSQAEGVGFPLARLVGIISTGAVLEAQLGPHSGKGRSELDLFVFCWRLPCIATS